MRKFFSYLVAIVISISTCFVMPAFAQMKIDVLKDNGYVFEIGHFPEEALIANESVQFSTFFHYENGNAVKNGKVWVRIAQGNKIFFSSSDFQLNNGFIDFELLLPDAGEYELTMRLIDTRYASEATVQELFTVEPNPRTIADTVEEGLSERRSNFNLAVLTLIIGGLSGMILSRAAPFLKSEKEGKKNNLKQK